tara:strand:- start:574 stop:1848 length:1275 start_codon:yes stop_codon:yes gene_type:complete
MSEESNKQPAFTEEFRKSIIDFTNDLTNTFPEYSHLWKKWSNDTSDFEFQELFEKCLAVYPERFFDILNQNNAIFSDTNVNTFFLPEVDFKQLFNMQGVSDKTKESIWKYLQVILLIIVRSLEDKMDFGKAMNMFNDLNIDDLQNQLEDVISNITDFFEKTQNDEAESENTENSEQPRVNIPKLNELQEHLQGLFDGKIGKLAKELAEDMGNDLAKELGEELEGVSSTKEVLSKLMQNPGRMGNVVNTVKEKLASKMESGEISKDDLMKEATEMMGKMKNLGEGLGDMEGMGNLGNLFNSFAQNMNIPKGARVNKSKMNQMEKTASLKERLRARALAKKQEQVVKQLESEAIRIQREKEYEKFIAENPNFLESTFSLDDKQEKSSVRDPNVLSASQKKRAKKKAKKQQMKEKNEKKMINDSNNA